MVVAVDTNVLVYAEGINDREREAIAWAVLQSYPVDELLLPAQVAQEFFQVLIRKGGVGAADARARVRQWTGLHAVIPTDDLVLDGAMELVESHRLGFWDALVLASSAVAGCNLLLTEDLQSGFTWRGVTVRNPFAAA